MTTHFNLQDVVDRALADSGSPDPHGIGRHALMRIGPGDREAALLIALCAYVEARMYEMQDESIPVRTIATINDVRPA